MARARSASSNHQLRHLRSIRHHYTWDATAAKRAILGAIAHANPRSLDLLVQLHEDLLFLRAFPDDAGIHALAGDGLRRIAVLLRRLPAARRAPADDSGMDGTTSRHTFEHPIARWLARKFPHDVEIDWKHVDDSARLDALIHPVVQHAELDAFESDELPTATWIANARGDACPSDLQWILDAGDAISRRTSRAFAAAYDSAEVPVAWNLDGSWASATLNQIALAPPVFRDGMRAAPAHPVRHIASPLPAIALLPRRQAVELIDVARAALAARCREVYAISYANPAEVWLAGLGEGASLAIIGAAAESRLSLESNYGYLLLSNGVPIGYGGVTPLFHQANTGINVFDPFRRGEAALLWAQMLRAFATLFGVRRFVVNAYQFGEGNAEAIHSGAFWFYYRLGFRPVVAGTRRLAAKEFSRIRRKHAYRSPAATLRALATCDLHLTLPGFPRGAFFDERWLVRTGVRATRLIAREDASTREASVARIAARVAAELGARPASWPVAERTAFARLAPVVALLPGVARWGRADREALVEILRAKGRAQERDFVLLAQSHPRFYQALIALVRTGQ
jgi:hypothetical protein